MPDGFGASTRMAIDEFPEYIDMVAQTRAEWIDRVDVRLGLEADYFPGYESWLDEQLKSAEFHYVLGSVHPQLREYLDRYWSGDSLGFQRSYFDTLALAAETGLFDCIAHPDMVKNVVCADWQPDRIMDDIRTALDRIAATGVAMELNTSGVTKIVPEMNPFPEMLAEMHKRRIPVVVGADAHEPGRVGDGFVIAMDLLREVGYSEVSYFLDRQRHSIPIDEARKSLAASKPAAA
jgi:histidinol-phosphatase (PHP family)